MAQSAARTDVVDKLDQRWLIDTLVELARVPTEVPPGPQVFMEPDDPKLVRYVQHELRPRLQDIGVYDILDVPRNQIVVPYGESQTDDALLLMSYTPTQHHNLMQDPFSGKIARATEWGVDEPCVFGQGVSQNKAHHAAMLAVLRLFAAHNVRLRGTLYFAVNNEGRSSHACSQAILAALPHKPGFGLIQLGTGLRLSLGNRGRVDVNVVVRGKASHSSSPHLGQSAVEGARRVLNRLQAVPLGEPHPILKGRHAIPYQLTFEPLAPHTLPEVARIRVDRRMLPGDDPDQATEDIRQAIGDLAPYQVTVERGETMLPALVDPEHYGVRALHEVHRQIRRSDLQTFYLGGTFDAGGPCAAGVPTVMYGAGGGVFPLGVDFVPISQVVDEARILAALALRLLG